MLTPMMLLAKVITDRNMSPGLFLNKWNLFKDVDGRAFLESREEVSTDELSSWTRITLSSSVTLARLNFFPDRLAVKQFLLTWLTNHRLTWLQKCAAEGAAAGLHNNRNWSLNKSRNLYWTKALFFSFIKKLDTIECLNEYRAIKNYHI